MEVVVKKASNGVVISARGDVDLYSSPKLREAIVNSARGKVSPIVVNLEGVTYIDSSGVATLVEGLQLSREYGGKLRLVNMSDRVCEVLRLARLDQIFDIHDTEEEALGSQ